MSEKQNTITVEELKTYLNSLSIEETQEKATQVYKYKDECEKKQKPVKQKEIQKIEKTIEELYKRRNQTKDKVIELLNKSKNIPSEIEELQIMKYMLYRVDIIRAENIIKNAIKRLSKAYKESFEEILELIEIYPNLKEVNEIDSSIYNVKSNALERAKEEYKEEYSDSERMELIKKELDIIEKSKIFYTTPIPHEILKNSDREIQMNMQKFNGIRQKRLMILSSMKDDYLKLTEPREIDCMIEDALISLDGVSEILTKSEYDKVKKRLIKRRKKIYRRTSEIRSIIKSKERRAGIINYNIQEARYERMEALRNKIYDAMKAIEMNSIIDAEKNLNKLMQRYDKEKQFASVIENLGESAPENANAQVDILKNEIDSLKSRIDNSKKIIEEQEEIIADAKNELIILWKIEINNTISNKKETYLELPVETEDIKNTKKNTFIKLKKMHKAKHGLA